MSYFTKYKISFHTIGKNNNLLLSDISPDLMKSLKHLSPFAVFDEPVSWYDHIEDLVRLAKAYPEIVIRLEGWGEEGADIWVKYFYGGKVSSYQAKIKFPPFDINKLL